MTTTHSPSSTGLATRLLAGQAIVLVAGALTVGLVAAVIGPPIFHQHLLEAGHQQNSPELVHIEMAYRDSSLISVGIGLLISLLAAGAVTWFLTRRLRRPLEQVTHAARELTMGHYATASLRSLPAPNSKPSPQPSTPWPPGSTASKTPVAECSRTWPTNSAPPSPPSARTTKASTTA
jgi:hypothetical protein